MSIKDKYDLSQDKIRVEGKSVTHHRTAITFLQDVQDLIKEGYEVYDSRLRKDGASFAGVRPFCTMIRSEALQAEATPIETKEALKEEEGTVEAPTEADVTPVEDAEDTPSLESLTTKKQLLEYTESKGLEIPEDKKVPKAIKQWLLNQEKV